MENDLWIELKEKGLSNGQVREFIIKETGRMAGERDLVNYWIVEKDTVIVEIDILKLIMDKELKFEEMEIFMKESLSTEKQMGRGSIPQQMETLMKAHLRKDASMALGKVTLQMETSIKETEALDTSMEKGKYITNRNKGRTKEAFLWALNMGEEL